MKIRLALALMLVLGIGTSVYCTEKAPALSYQITVACCSGGSPDTPGPIPLPTPLK
jgi:hypothetical protein